jgi:hypothetical protein
VRVCVHTDECMRVCMSACICTVFKKKNLYTREKIVRNVHGHPCIAVLNMWNNVVNGVDWSARGMEKLLRLKLDENELK